MSTATEFLSEETAYRVATEAFNRISMEKPELANRPGYMAEVIHNETGVDFTVAAIVSMSAAG